MCIFIYTYTYVTLCYVVLCYVMLCYVMYVCMHACMYACMYVRMYVCIGMPSREPTANGTNTYRQDFCRSRLADRAMRPTPLISVGQSPPVLMEMIRVEAGSSTS